MLAISGALNTLFLAGDHFTFSSYVVLVDAHALWRADEPVRLRALLLVGGALAIGLGLPRPPARDVAAPIVRPLRRAGGMLERADGVLRRWPVAGLSLLALAVLFGAAMRAHA